MVIRFSGKSGFVLALLLLLTVGCDTRNNKAATDHYLIRIGQMVVTGKDYLEALEVMKASYPYDALQDVQVLKTLKTRLLKQLTEELILTKRAEELGLSVSDAEVEKVVKAIKESYPDGVFEKTLFEKAILLRAWEKRVKMRLLTEKVIDKELVATISMTPEEVNKFYQSGYADKVPEDALPEIIDAAFVKQLRREKAEKQYPQWINQLQQKYDIELNERQWAAILN